MNDADSTRQVMLITGTARGLGHALAVHYLDAEYRVHGCSRGPCAIEHGSYTHTCLDVADESAVNEWLSSVDASSGRLDVALNNAGISRLSPCLLQPVDEARAMLETNVLGVAIVTREAARMMRKRRYGRIVNFSSIAVPQRIESEGMYAATKAAVETLTRIQARELGPFGITVNTVGPSLFETGMTSSLPQAVKEDLLQRQSIRRPAELADLIHVIDFFIGPASGFVTGQTVYLGGP